MFRVNSVFPQYNKKRHGSRAFSLTEVLIVIFILAIVFLFTVPVGIRFFAVSQLDTATDEVIQTLRRSQALSSTQENDSTYGVFFSPSGYTLFKGGSYATRDSSYDQVYILSGDVTAITSFVANDVIFKKLSGEPDESGLITLSNSAGSRVIEVSLAGRINLVLGDSVPSVAFSLRNSPFLSLW